MKSFKQKSMSLLVAAAAAGLLGVTGCAQMQSWMGVGSAHAMDDMQKVTLTGQQEVPPNEGSNSATGDITVKADGSVSGSIKVTGFTPTAAHIHQGPPGVVGPVIVPMTKQGDDTFVFPPNAKMTPDQLAAYKAGNTYVNVHSAAHPVGEIRAQLKSGM